MKAFFEFVKEVGLVPVKTLGWVSLTLLAMTQIPQLNYIPKVIILYILTPFVMGSR